MRRAGLVVLAVVVALAGSVGIVAFLNSRDDAQLETAEEGPGEVASDATADRLRRGNVVLTYRSEADGRRLRALAEEISGPADASLVDAGQAVVVTRAGDQADPVVATAYRRRLRAPSASDPQVREFVEFWLGKPAVE